MPTTHPRPHPLVGRSMVASQFGVVATSQPLASMAGVGILEHGGTAVDAAIAANATVGVLEPTGSGLGGDLFAIVYNAATDTLHGLNASGWSPRALTIELLASRGITGVMPERGVHSITVPGVVAGWDALRARFGTLSFDALLAPAIWYAEHGFPVGEVTSTLWANSAELLASHPNARDTFLVAGRAPRAGELFRNPDLATSLTRIARDGRDGFYRSPTADAIIAIMRDAYGTMTHDDLADFEPEWVTPLTTKYREWDVSELPPNGQGIAALEMLNIMQRFPLGAMGWQSADALHVMIEAKKLAYADLLRYIGDPRFAHIPVNALLSNETAAERAWRIHSQRAATTVMPTSLESIRHGGDTIYLAAIDRTGNIVSLIQSNYSGFGSGLVPPRTGFMLQNRGALFSLDPNSPNALAPRKRPLHTIIPGFMRKGLVRIGFGIMGGWNQAQAHAQFVSHIADHGLTIQEALEAGRFTKLTFAGCDVQMEAAIAEPTRTALAARGHEIEVVPGRSTAFGFGQAVMSNEAGIHFGASDPRHDGAAIPELAPMR